MSKLIKSDSQAITSWFSGVAASLSALVRKTLNRATPDVIYSRSFAPFGGGRETAPVRVAVFPEVTTASGTAEVMISPHDGFSIGPDGKVRTDPRRIITNMLHGLSIILNGGAHPEQVKSRKTGAVEDRWRVYNKDFNAIWAALNLEPKHKDKWEPSSPLSQVITGIIAEVGEFPAGNLTVVTPPPTPSSLLTLSCPARTRQDPAHTWLNTGAPSAEYLLTLGIPCGNSGCGKALEVKESVKKQSKGDYSLKAYVALPPDAFQKPTGDKEVKPNKGRLNRSRKASKRGHKVQQDAGLAGPDTPTAHMAEEAPEQSLMMAVVTSLNTTE